MKKADWIMIAAVFIIAAAILIFQRIFVNTDSSKDRQVEILYKNQVLGTYALEENREIPVNTEEGYNLIVLEGGYVYVKDADCANRICMQSGKKKETGETITCLPHKLIITVK